MNIKTAFAAAAALSALASPALADRPQIDRGAIVQLSCNKGTGTGVVIAPNNFITANHVLVNDTCEVSGQMGRQRFQVVYEDNPGDFALASTVGAYRSQLTIGCAPLATGERYWMVGFPGGYRDSRTVEVTATADYFDVGVATGITRNVRAVEGRSIAGMSGGAVVDAEGNLRAFISAVGNDSPDKTLVKELADTPICQG